MNSLSSTPKRDLLSLLDLSTAEILHLFARASILKTALKAGETVHPLKGRTLAMVFEKPSTRTRVSFETGMYQLGGHALFLSSKEMQLGRGEEISDSARVLSRYVNGIMVRTFAHENLLTMARYATVPVINGLSDDFHPCQILTDIFTFQEHRGPIAGRKVAWIGDGNNVAHSWILAAARLGFHLVMAIPNGYEPKASVLEKANQEIAKQASQGSITLLRQPSDAVADADLVTTDAWTSMGQEQEQKKRQKAFADYCVDSKLMRKAKAEALFMHCLPAHRGEEVTSEVLDGPQSVVWDEAENRLHVQKAILEWLLA
ncbi:ornithine carbamoyltransferase [Candidatus Magnetaquicoccus inordinatus]|uniref:ornithine carbamoyltransferase n=1 Tax=Candidatus Magnetaquicoccus inordinatus TaxID=2496818 RepID=UPI00102C5389|nr:ornithine carbamoyltransferase [Candidatus Magnetaquicoccus inordinatus]